MFQLFLNKTDILLYTADVIRYNYQGLDSDIFCIIGNWQAKLFNKKNNE